MKAVYWILSVSVTFLSVAQLVFIPELKADEIPVLEAPMVFAPNVPPPVNRDYETRVIVRMESTEYRGELSKGVEYDFWGYNGHVPGPFIRIRQGDMVEFHFKNAPGSKNTHTIDFHAMTGPCGAACILLTEPGEESIVQAKAVNPGLFIYHCAAPPIPVHIANGLYGLILVEPKEGLPKVDREYYVLQSEFYTEGDPGTKGFVPFSSQKGMDEKPTYVVFNGKVGALMGEGAIQAKVGETVRLFVGNAGPNLVSSFHVIGEIFDRVYSEASVQDFVRNVQTTLIPSGGASMVEFQVDYPGDYTLVDHSIFRINRGAMGSLHVEGPENPEILKKIQ